jgi:hypothetical protein
MKRTSRRAITSNAIEKEKDYGEPEENKSILRSRD